MKILGECFGIQLIKRGIGDSHVCINIMVEDDEIWHNEMTLSSYWLDEMIEVLQQTKDYCEKNCIKDEHGYYFKNKGDIR
jgi:hypothetical protein